MSDDSEEFSAIEEEVKKYLGTLRRNVKERKLKVFMEQLTSKSNRFLVACLIKYISPLIRQMICLAQWMSKLYVYLPCKEYNI